MKPGYGCRWVWILLPFLLLASSTGLPAEKPGAAQGIKARAIPTAGDKLLLSLRIAKARKAGRKIGYFKSVARQQRHGRPATAPPPSSAR